MKCFICDGDIDREDVAAADYIKYVPVTRDGEMAHTRCHRAYWKGVEYARAEMTPKPIVCPRCQERHGHPVHWCHCQHPYHAEELVRHIEQHQRGCTDPTCADSCHLVHPGHEMKDAWERSGRVM